MSFDPTHWHWPQWTVAILYVVGLAISAALNGTPKTNSVTGEPHKYNFAAGLFSFALITFVLTAGGFYR